MGLYTQLSQLTSAAPGGKQTWCVSDILRRLPTFISLVTVWPDLFDIFDQLMPCRTPTVSFGIYKLSFEVKLECSMRQTKPNVMNKESTLLLPGGLYSNEAVEGDNPQWKFY